MLALKWKLIIGNTAWLTTNTPKATCESSKVGLEFTFKPPQYLPKEELHRRYGVTTKEEALNFLKSSNEPINTSEPFSDTYKGAIIVAMMDKYTDCCILFHQTANFFMLKRSVDFILQNVDCICDIGVYAASPESERRLKALVCSIIGNIRLIIGEHLSCLNLIIKDWVFGRLI